MKKILLLFVIFSFTNSFLFSQCGNLYIAGVIDGDLTGGNPKGVQVCAIGAITDLSIYGIGSANNGGGSDGEEFTFPADALAAGDCVWVGASTSGWMDFFGFDPDYTSSAANINGDDAIELFCSGEVEDIFGVIDVNGDDECWDYTDSWAVALDNVPSAAFSCAEWCGPGAGGLDGATSNAAAAAAGCAYPFPSSAPDGSCPGTCANALPVELTSFTVTYKQKEVSLTWTTVSELNNSHFEIEYSIDGASFRAIDEVAGNGTTQLKQEYSYTHKTPANGTNYYRLKQVDYDGAFEYSDTRVVEVKRTGKIVINPSAAIAEITVELAETTGDNNLIGIYDMMGRTVMMSNFDGTLNTKTLDISNLQKGYYVVRVQAGSQIFTERFMKMVD